MGAAIATGLAVTFFIDSFALPSGLKPEGVLVEPWISDVDKLRNYIYAQHNDPSKHTIFVIAGSNSLFSIASEEITKSTGYNVNNYGLHVGLHPDLLFSQITTKVKPGDIVVAPLEWIDRRSLGNVFDIDNYFVHYRKSVSLPWYSAYVLWTSVTLKRWWSGLEAYIYAPAGAVRLWDLKSTEEMESEREKYTGPFRYAFFSLDKDGDLNPKLTMTHTSWMATEDPRPGVVSPIEKEILATWKTRFEKLGARFFLTNPAILQNRHGSFLTSEFWADLEARRAALKANGTPIHCDPLAAVLASIYRYDTVWHPNATGATIYSQGMAECLDETIRGADTETRAIDPDQMVKLVEARLEKQREDYGLGNLPFQQRLRDLTQIRDALEAYKRDNGAYPKSVGYDGIASDWGKRSPDYIDGLVPRYLSSLPVDPAGPAGLPGQPQYLYWSNGEGYKIVSASPAEECAVVAVNWPKLVDPARLAKKGDLTSCFAYADSVAALAFGCLVVEVSWYSFRCFRRRSRGAQLFSFACCHLRGRYGGSCG
ncbi:hypothetical protein EWH13_34730 [Bradyrhizobium elkanii]|nr:hypothetical protein EWH13_34730 [Bradyrhizobium elkanii]